MKHLTQHPFRNLPHVRAALYAQPWLITEHWLGAMCEMFEQNVAGIQTDFQAAAPAKKESGDDDAQFDMVNGVAILQMRGPIFPRANLLTRMSGATSLEEFSSNFDAAMQSNAQAIILDMDSPGGAVSGVFEFCDKLNLAALTDNRPIIAFANGTCASGAYAIASQCNEVYATPASLVGSIGVVMKMDDNSRQQKNDGTDSVVLSSHELKGTGLGPMSGNQVADMQRIVDGLFETFKATVNRARPGVNLDAVATGQCWQAQIPGEADSALSLGLVDGIATLQGLISKFGTD